MMLICVIAAPAAVQAQVSRGQQLLIDHGLQLHGMVTKDDVFHPERYPETNYTAVNWMWESNTSLHGTPPGMPWARWVSSPATMPPLASANEAPYMSQLVALQIGDEYDLNNPDQRQHTIDWLNSARPQFPNTLLVVNNYGSQVNDASLADLIARGRPDVISFDTYPYLQGSQPLGGSPLNWYSDMRRYRQHGLATNTPVGQYRQTFHDNYWRDPSPSEFRLNTFGALAFNVKYMADFTFNTGASAFFTTPGGDSNPTPLYNDLIQVNREARNLGKALVYLKPVPDAPGVSHTTSMMFIRGKHMESGTPVMNDFPGYSGFVPDPQNAAYTDWEFGRNDPYLSGPFNDASILNIAGTKNDGLDGDVLISWFEVIDESFDGPAAEEVYMMVTNGLADMTGSAADTRQRIRLNFGSSGVRFPYDHLEMLDRNSGEIVDVPLNQLTTNVWQLELTLDGGTSELFKYPTGAPFVGVDIVPEPSAMALFGLAGLGMLRRRVGAFHHARRR
jgi:hypothetical protein